MRIGMMIPFMYQSKAICHVLCPRIVRLAQQRPLCTSRSNRGLNINLSGQTAFVAGVGDTSGYGWAISKQLADAGATILIGCWPPALAVLKRAIERGDRSLAGGGEMEISRIYPFDANYSTAEEVPQETLANRRYADLQEGFDIRSVAQAVARDYKQVDVLVHSLAHAPEIDSPLLKTSRKGYLAASSTSAYSFVSMMQEFGPLMPRGACALSLTYGASFNVVPGYGGGMSSAKAQLESDIRTLAWEAGRQWGVRVNAISAGPLKSRAASAIRKASATGQEDRGFIDKAIAYSRANSPLSIAPSAAHVAAAALALCSPLGQGITGECVHVDAGMHVMGMAVDSESLRD